MSISALSKQCAELFNRCLASAISEPEKQAKIEDHLFRFNLWAQNNAAISEKRDSLDWCLRKALVPQSVMEDLLKSLLESLNNNLSPIEPTRQRSSGDDVPENIGDILEELFRFSRAIRHSGAMLRALRASNYFEYDETSGENLTAKFQDTVLPYLNATLKSATGEMKERLSETICLRHQSLSLLRSRSSRKIALRPVMKPGLESTEPTPQASSKFGKASSVRRRETTQGESQAGQIQSHGKRVTPSVWTATTANANQISRIVTIVEQETAEYLDVDLPLRPKVPAGQSEFECPYCFLVYPAKEYTKENWPRHIIKDLSPFVCVLERCPTPNAIYESHAAWISHMETAHACQGWTCMDSGHSSSRYFEDEQSFRCHIIEHHYGDMTEEELADFTEECYGPLLAFQLLESCPFCSEYTDDASTDLDKHITRHLLYLSQVSIPGDFLEMQGVEPESEPDESNSNNRLEGSKLSHEFGFSPISSFRTLKSKTSALSPTVRPADSRLADDIMLEIESPNQETDSEYSLSAVVDSEMASGLCHSFVSPTMKLEPPTSEYTPGEPDIWDRLQVRERLQDQKIQKPPKYDTEMESNLWNFRLRYILELATGDSDSNWVSEMAVIKSCLQLGRVLDANGRYFEAEKILTKILSGLKSSSDNQSRNTAGVMILNMLQSCTLARYKKVREDVSTITRAAVMSHRFVKFVNESIK